MSDGIPALERAAVMAKESSLGGTCGCGCCCTRAGVVSVVAPLGGASNGRGGTGGGGDPGQEEDTESDSAMDACEDRTAPMLSGVAVVVVTRLAEVLRTLSGEVMMPDLEKGCPPPPLLRIEDSSS